MNLHSTGNFDVTSTKSDKCLPSWNERVVVSGFYMILGGIVFIGTSILYLAWIPFLASICVAVAGMFVTFIPQGFKECGTVIEVIGPNPSKSGPYRKTFKTYYFQFTEDPDADAKKIKIIVNKANAQADELQITFDHERKIEVGNKQEEREKEKACCTKYQITMNKVTGDNNQ